MNIINKAFWFILLFPTTGNAQVLGPVQGDNVEISSVGGATQNSFMNKQWLYRNQNSNDWLSARLHDGISVDISFLTPHINTRSWWERDPYNNIQSWGDAGDTYLTINKGNVGIGTASPQSKLHIYQSATDQAGLVIQGTTINPDGAQHYVALTLDGDYGNGTGNYSQIRSYSNLYHFWGSRLAFFTTSSTAANTLLERMRIDAEGNVGIGTIAPKEKLSVNGKIRAHEIKVETNNWPDYVFAKEYRLPTLQETENHIKEKGHLQGIPSAEEVTTNGINLGDMNAKLLQKIEELTLHVIELSKTVQKQQIQINNLNRK